MAPREDTQALVEDMNRHLPIPARPTRDTQQYLRTKGVRLSLDHDLLIVAAFNSGDEGGILCAIAGDNTQPVIISITYLRIAPDHPLSGRILAYQRKRMKHLSLQGNQRTYEYKIRPSKRRSSKGSYF
jgi:hypothetical protein